MLDVTVTIGRLGDQGDGVAETPDGRLFVPFTAPGDVVRVTPVEKSGATLTELVTPGPNRVTPPCRHFGTCGGCALQHLDLTFVAAWKRARIVSALTAVGLGDTPVEATITIPPGTRRRATLGARRTQGGILLGFAERATHRLIDLAECWVLRPELVTMLAPLRGLLTRLLLPGETADVALTLTETGVDLTLIRPRALTLADRESLGDFGQTHDLAQIAWRPTMTKPPEPVAMRRSPMVRFGEYRVALPPSGFLQPSAEGEAALTKLVLDAIGQAESAVDLFSGLGTFTLPASGIGPVAAYDLDGKAIDAVVAALRLQKPVHKIQAIKRDLFREPLNPTELSPFEAAIIDPPRVGAAAQSKMLANSNIPVIAVVSCNPNSFARDAATLSAGGFRLTRVTPVDQFSWSTHVELVGVFRRNLKNGIDPGGDRTFRHRADLGGR